MTTQGGKHQACRIAGLLALLAAVLLPVTSAAAADRKVTPTADTTLIVFGGIGYVEEDTQSTLYDILIAERDGGEGAYPVSNRLDTLVSGAPGATAGFPTLSDYPVALYRADAESAMKAVSRGDTLPRYAIGSLETYFGRILGLIFIGSYEDHFTFEQRDPLKKGDSKIYSDYFTTSVSAVLFDLQTREIVLSSSAIGLDITKVASEPVYSEKDKRLHFAKSYLNAAELAFSRLRMLAAQTDARSLDNRDARHMVTGIWVGTQGARDLFEWDKPEPGTDMCNIPNGCRPGSKKCGQLAGLLVHGLTSSLSEAGHATLPPLNFSDWRQDTAYEVGVRLHLPQDRKSMVGGLRRFSISPRLARIKHVAKLDFVSHEMSPDPDGISLTDDYYAQLSRVRARTNRNACEPQGEPETIRDEDFLGVISFTRHASQPAPSSESEEAYFKYAIINALPKLSKGEQ